MEQLRQVGEVLGGVKALMVLKHDISINQRQCCLLLHMFDLAFETISEMIKQNLRLEDKNSKWKALENPLRELQRVFKEGELYIRNCLDIRDWWGKAMSLHQNKDCVEFHIHNLLWCFTIVIEALETSGETSATDQDEMQKRRLKLMRKYDKEWNDPKTFLWKYGKQYLVPGEICNRMASAWKEDRWILLETIREKRSSAINTIGKHEQRLADLLLRKLTGLEPLKGKLLPSWILIGAKDYQVRRRLGSGGSHYKEIQWFGESFALRNFFGEIDERMQNEIHFVQSLSHPNIMQFLCGFYDEERKEGYLVMELMSKCLGSYVKENCGQRKRIPFSLPVAVDIMLQIARGMEYLHSQKIYHGELNPSNILLKARNSSPEGYYYAKIKGFGLTSIKSYTCRTQPNQNGDDTVIWYAPEILAGQEQHGSKCSSKYTEKADVYSFGMLCFEILTGKIPFEEGHLQEDKMGRNIRAGERPLFPYTSPKFLVNLTRKCWQPDPIQRPTFSSICRILRYIKKCLVINPDLGQPELPPQLLDFCEIESEYSKLFPGDSSLGLVAVSQVPFQMFAYRIAEKERTSGSFQDKIWELSIDENGVVTQDPLALGENSPCSMVQERKFSLRTRADQKSVGSETPDRRSLSASAPDQPSSSGSENQGRKASMDDDERSKNFGSPEMELFISTAADQISGSETPENKTSSATEDNQKSVGSKISRTRTYPGKAVDQIYSEKKTLSRTEGNSVSSKISHGKVSPSIVSSLDLASISSASPDRKFLAKKKIIVAKSSNGPGTQRENSLRSSQVRTLKGYSPKSSTKSTSMDPFVHSSRNRQFRVLMSPSRHQRDQPFV